MNRTTTMCTLVLAATPDLAMAAAPVTRISDLAATTGLSDRQVQMILGARTAYPEYLTQYNRSERRFVKALGAQRYEDLMAGARSGSTTASDS